ncbi:MAG TPA: hypothetical protein DD670_11380, partial [Planctomycetaceae bacterium]|nr:hypothetical protein [Planctomycetaceae bacterium]
RLDNPDHFTVAEAGLERMQKPSRKTAFLKQAVRNPVQLATNAVHSTPILRPSLKCGTVCLRSCVQASWRPSVKLLPIPERDQMNYKAMKH